MGMGEKTAVAGWWVFGVVLVVATGVIFSLVGLGLTPWQIRQETKIIRASNSYITSKQDALMTLKADYDRLGPEIERAKDPMLKEALQGQRDGIVWAMRQEAAHIPDDVPPPVAALLRGSR
jgi:hypothetical protein